MNFKILLFCLLGAVFVISTAYSDYSSDVLNKNKIKNNLPDVVNGFAPAHAPSPELRALVEKLQNAKNNKERREIMNEYGEEILTLYITGYLRSEGYNCYIDDFVFGYGTGIADSVTYDHGWIQTGIYRDEPYVRVTGGECFGKGLIVFITCGNLTSFKLFKPEEEVVIASVLDHPLFAITDKN